MKLTVLLLLLLFLAACTAVAPSRSPESAFAPVVQGGGGRQAPAQPYPAPPENGRVANADVTFVTAVRQVDGTWTFSVTVAHPDRGWDDYADGWDVVLLDGSVVKPDPESPFTRLLLHPHETEQPFTRSQSGIVIPEGVTAVTVRAHDLVDGFGGREVRVDLMTAASGPDFEVIRNE